MPARFDRHRVSHVINGRATVRPKLRERVLDPIGRCGLQAQCLGTGTPETPDQRARHGDSGYYEPIFSGHSWGVEDVAPTSIRRNPLQMSATILRRKRPTFASCAPIRSPAC